MNYDQTIYKIRNNKLGNAKKIKKSIHQKKTNNHRKLYWCKWPIYQQNRQMDRVRNCCLFSVSFGLKGLFLNAWLKKEKSDIHEDVWIYYNPHSWSMSITSSKNLNLCWNKAGYWNVLFYSRKAEAIFDS